MGILGYNTRIMELRQQGHNIVTTMEEIQKIWRNREARAVFAGVGGQAIIARQSS